MRSLLQTLAAAALLAFCATAHADEPHVQNVGGRCGESAEHTAARPLSLRAHATARGAVRVSVRNLVFNCGSVPVVTPATTGDHQLTLTARMREGAPVASCVCFHEVELMLTGLAAGHWTLRMQSGAHLATTPAGLVSQLDFATATVDVR